MKLQNEKNNNMENDIEAENQEDDVENSTFDPNSINQDLFLDSDVENLPKSLIVTNLDVDVFNIDGERLKFEELFHVSEEDITFQYFKSFRRARVNFCSPSAAARARIQLHQAHVCGKPINCYFVQPVTPKDNGHHPYLQLPAPVKQFLISPPASPPVGWEPVDEATPVINYDLLSAIAKLAPGEAHELHPPSETQPGIVVHICEEEEEKEKKEVARTESIQASCSSKPVILPTRCPERNT